MPQSPLEHQLLADQLLLCGPTVMSGHVQSHLPQQAAPPPGLLTVRDVTGRGPMGTTTCQHLRSCLRKWAQACSIASDPGRVCIAELLPHYARLLSHLDMQHSSKQLTTSTAFRQLAALCHFLKAHQHSFDDGRVDYAAMLSSMEAARRRYPSQGNATAHPASLGNGIANIAQPGGAGPPSQPGDLQSSYRMSIGDAAGSVAQQHLGTVLRKWAQMCGILGVHNNVCVAELLPHYSQLLCFLDDMQNSSQLSPSTIYQYLKMLCSFLSTHQQALQSSSVDYAAMLSSMQAARFRYSQVRKGLLQVTQQGLEGALSGSSLVGRKRKALLATIPALDAAPLQHKVQGSASAGGGSINALSSTADLATELQPMLPAAPARCCSAAAAGAAAAAAMSAGGSSIDILSSSTADLPRQQPMLPAAPAAAAGAAAAAMGAGGSSINILSSSTADLATELQQLQQVLLGAPATAAATAAGTEPPAAAAIHASGAARGTALSSPAAQGSIISMADLLQQLQSNSESEAMRGGACIKQMQESAACFFGGVGLDTIPASLLLTHYIADVGHRAQQCLSAGGAGQQDEGGTGKGATAECLAVMQEVGGLLLLSGQPVLQQVLGGQRLQELVEGLLRCKQQLGDKL